MPADAATGSAGTDLVDSWRAKLSEIWSRLQAGDRPSALSRLEDLMASRPDHAETQLNMGFLASRLGEAELAVRSYRQALASCEPGAADDTATAALINLTSLLIGLGRFEEAYDELVDTPASPTDRDGPRRGERLNTVPEFHFNLGTCCAVFEDGERAIGHLRTALSLRPSYVEAARNLALILLQDGSYEESAALLRDSIEAGADGLEMLYGLVRLALFDIDGAMERFRLARPTDVPTAQQEESRRRQEAEQDAYLAHQDAVEQPAAWQGGSVVRPRPSREWTDLDTKLAASRRSVVVVDDVLSEGALATVRTELLTRRIWRGATAASEVITTLDRGLSRSPVVLHLANELRQLLPQSIGQECLTEAWAYQYRDYKGCTQAHGDAARYSVNLWLTPDDANIGDPDAGGLRLWSRKVFDYTPAVGNSENQMLADMGRHRSEADIVVPYRCNRAVVFDALTVHETDVFRFRPEFENRRINMTLLFGWPG